MPRATRLRIIHHRRRRREQAAIGKAAKYNISDTHQFMPIAIETGGSWCQAAISFISELGRRTVVVTGDSTELLKTVF